ncbi:RHS repeat-associated core domain-containing protein [Catenulispora yoronensis]|uniref:RHS repeat-associated core domain-containing protein n=2 Tax=Catenulispora yoronensis TaxID=450799 RepID=A0ABP5GFX1_9ACTN
MWDRAAATRAGVSGVVFTLTSAGGEVTADLDYSAFRNAGGPDFGSRLRLVQLPACVLTTPDLPACQVQTPIASSHNDPGTRTLTADVTLPTASVAGGTVDGTDEGTATDGTGAVIAKPAAFSRSAAAMTAAAPVVLAATSGTSGANGDFTATSLGPSGTWTAGGSSGDFSWTYPITVPPAAAGSAPKIALSYDAASVDGRTATTNNQPSWVGEGWDYSPGYIERTYNTCSNFTDLPTASQTSDQCWAGQILTLNLNGASNALVWDSTSGQVRLKADDGSRVEHLTGAANGAQGGEYWKVTTTSGTQYFFGRTSGPGFTNQGTTNSTWTEPVFGAHSGDPCHNAAGFSSSVCTQAWRWNLDYVEDPHGNVAMYYYTPETNYYGQNNGTTGVAYTRNGWLNRIDYGIRDENGTVYGATVPEQVVFNVAERCIPGTPAGNTCDDSQFTSANSASWPDVPIDQNCASGATCNIHAPTFWSRKMLSNITTQYWNGTNYVKVDSYDLGHSFPNGGDPALWLNSITRTGYDATGASISMPQVWTEGQLLPNRVPGYQSLPPMLHWRMTNLHLETGDTISVTYSTGCSKTTIPADASTNGTQCMPVYWQPPGFKTPIFDWFDKYVVTEVDEADPKALTPKKKTFYNYVGDAAWHFDDNEVVKPTERTYGQFRGYGEVDVKAGDPVNGESLTKSASYFFRGMNGDTLPNSGTRTASVTNTLGETTPDDNRFAGVEYESQVFNGDGGPELSATLTTPTVVATTATRNRTGLPAQTADLVRTAQTRALTDKAAGGVRTVTTVNTYDTTGRLTSADATGDGVPEVCTTTAYADNTGSWIREHTSEVIASQQACPPAGTAQTNVLSDTRTYYDGSTTPGQLTGVGDATRTDVLNNSNGQAPAFLTKGTQTYDASGRVLTNTDTLGHVITTAYTPADGGLLTQTVVTNPANQATTSVVNPDRGTTASLTSIAGHVTSATYDALGRLTQVWKPGRTQGLVTPNVTYAYLLQNSGPETVTTNTLVDYGSGTNYVTDVRLSDALGREVQTQTASENGGSKVSDTFYDGHGWAVATNDHYLISVLPSNTVQQVAVSAVDARTTTTFDGSGRPLQEVSWKNGAQDGTTTTVYGGDRTTVIPPAGGTTATTVTDAHGNTVELDQYTAAPTVAGSVVSGGTFQPTTYTYDALDRRTKTVSAGATWSVTLDLVGNKLSVTDPDAGTVTNRYDNGGELVSSTDANGQTLAYAYDVMGRKTAEYSGSTAGTKLASWLWDSLQAGKLTSQTRYTSGGNYTTGVTGFDGQGDPTGQLTTIPAAETGLNKNWTTRFGYSTTGLLTTITPASVTGMPGETITNTYDGFGNPIKVSGLVTASQKLSGYDLPGVITYGGSTNNAWQQFTYDARTLKVRDANVTAQRTTAQVDDTVYAYNQSGQITEMTDTQGPAGTAPVDDQCFTYDALGRLGAAWTATDKCAGAPNNAATGGNIGGPNPYWTTWQFNPDGTRSSQVQHALPGAPTGDTTTAYTYTSPAGSHRLAGTATSGATTRTTGYTYDSAGNTKTRSLPSGSQNLTWDPEERLASVTDGTGATLAAFVNDADGNQLIRRDPTSTTLYLPGEEVTRTSAGVITAKRQYTLGGTVVGESDGTTAGTVYLMGDAHATQQVAINAATLALTRRSFDPYGNTRGATAGGAWPDTHGFLDKPVEAATGLTDIGARKYDATLGMFISPDPKVDFDLPQSLPAYTYASDNPVVYSDPSGLSWWSKHWKAVATVAVVVAVVAVAVVAAPVVLPAMAAAAEAVSVTGTVAATAAAEAATTATIAGASPAMALAVGGVNAAAATCAATCSTAAALTATAIAAEGVNMVSGAMTSGGGGRGRAEEQGPEKAAEPGANPAPAPDITPEEPNAKVYWQHGHATITVTANGRRVVGHAWPKWILPPDAQGPEDAIKVNAPDILDEAPMGAPDYSTTLPDPEAAMEYMDRQQHGMNPKYMRPWNREDNSCLTYCADVLNAGGATEFGPGADGSQGTTEMKRSVRYRE